jgi:hypothetical protein
VKIGGKLFEKRAHPAEKWMSVVAKKGSEPHVLAIT